jgi:hypothetical protein
MAIKGLIENLTVPHAALFLRCFCDAGAEFGGCDSRLLADNSVSASPEFEEQSGRI